ncbi:MAG: hypothetical protein ACPL28_08170 [bacterium]
MIRTHRFIYALCLIFIAILVTCSRQETDFEINDFCYQLQNINLSQNGTSAFDLVIIDYSQYGDDESRFTPAQINDLKKSSGEDKIVVSYMRIGEAENYRWYWHSEWDADNDGEPDPGAPEWLGPMNPDWEGNYKVKHWDPGWQGIIFGSN